MAGTGPSNLVARRVIDDLADFSGETAVSKEDWHGENNKLMALNDLIAQPEEEIDSKETYVEMMYAASKSDLGKKYHLNLKTDMPPRDNDFAIGAVLGKRQDKHFRPIHYASKTMTEVESKYTMTVKEMLEVVLEEEKAYRRGKVFSWETATYGKIWDNEDVHDLESVEIEFPDIVFNGTLTFEIALSCEPTVEGYTEEIVHNFKQRLETIIGRQVNRMHTLDFEGLTPDMRHDLAERLRMVYTEDDGQEYDLETIYSRSRLAYCRGDGKGRTGAYWLGCERVILDKGDLSDYQIEISFGRDFLRGAPSYTYIKDSVPRLCHRHAEGRKSSAILFRGNFMRLLAHHFGLISNAGLRGLSVVTHELPLIDMGELVKLNMHIEIGDDWAWVAHASPIHAPPPPPPAAEARLAESTIPLNKINSQIPPSIVITTSHPLLPIKDLEDSLITRNEDLNTIPEKKSDKFIKFSVKDLVLILSESEDTPESDSECIFPLCDDFSPINIFEEKAVIFSNPLLNLNDDFISSDDESLSDEDVPEDNVKIYSNPLFEFDDKYIFSDVNPIFDEVLEDIECKDSYDPNLDESTFLVTPLSDSNEDEYFTPGNDVELLLHHDPFIPMISVASILEGFTDEPPLEENDNLFNLEPKNDDWKEILYDAPINDLMTEDKVFDPKIHDQIFSPTYVSLPFTDRHYIFFTYVIRILLLYFTYSVVSPFFISSGSEDTIFDPGISALHFSHRSGTFISFNIYPNILNESPMENFPSTCFTLNITMIWASRARGFVYRPLKLQSLAYGNPIS
nr:reverse transcriptase domain-containing protein [Tanacetum cinerariifolium]